MKRGKDDEKIMVPMFPRLHVNDKEKGGPRAPPRNKMALYEQLSIPSHRLNTGVMSPNPNNTPCMVHPASTSQGNGHENGLAFPRHLPRSARAAENSYVGFSDLNPPMAQLEHRKKVDEEDFAVPIFVQSEKAQDQIMTSNGMVGKKLSPFNPPYLSHSLRIQNSTNEESKQTSITVYNISQEARSQNKENLNDFVAFGGQSVKSVKSSSAGEKTKRSFEQICASADSEHRDSAVKDYDRLQNNDDGLHNLSRGSTRLQNSMFENDVLSEPVRRDASPQELRSPNNSTPNGVCYDDKTRGSSQMGNSDRGDDASETSMVDSVSVLDISPDDVVGMIGQKHFWKARKAIVNQQRVFAVQVFELHRLIKVQKLIAGLPNLMLEESAYLGKTLKGSSAQKLPSEYIVKPSPHIVKQKDDSDNNLTHKMESSAENAVGKTVISPAQNVDQPSNYGPLPLSGNPMNPWCFNQVPGHQWLIPVMSPSEGLVYKPYPKPGFAGSASVGYGLPGSNPMMCNFINPGYGVPGSHHHYQGIGYPPVSPPINHSYFPPYGMPSINPVNSDTAVEQANQFSRHGQPGQVSGGEADFNSQIQSSCNESVKKKRVTSESTQKNGATSNIASELQGSTASSPAKRMRGTRLSHSTEGRNALPLFPTSPAVHVLEGAPPQLPTEADKPTRIIRVVPHNARSATESAARIFRSIQAERKQHEHDSS